MSNKNVEKFNIAIEKFDHHFNSLDGFEFRNQQRETIINLAKSLYLSSDPKVQILDAPTGSGKSIIALGVSIILNFCGLEGYIITSDLGLQRQYERDLRVFDTSYHSLMGKENYICGINGLSIPQAECAGLSKKQLLKLPCYMNCEYYSVLNKCKSSKTVVFNYSIWLMYLNIVMRNSKNPPFLKRDFVIFDEAHKIDEIVLSAYTPTIKRVTPKYNELHELLTYDLDIRDLYNGSEELEYLYNQLRVSKNNTETCDLLFDMVDILNQLIGDNVKSRVTNRLNYLYPKEKYSKYPKKILKLLKKYEDFRNYSMPIIEFKKYLEYSQDFEFVKNVDNVLGTITIKPLNTYNLCKRYLTNNAERSIRMSATFGNHDQYSKISGFSSYDSTILENTFNYKRSPIISINDGVSMNYKNLDQGIIDNTNNAKRIFDIYPSKKGIVHSGTYNITNKMVNILKQDPKYANRIFYYKSSKERDFVLEEFKKSSNGILIAPSILEGVSLDDDLSRFQIIMKIPYLSLGDDYIKIKMKKDRSWYQWKTALKILQGIGRSIRNKDDFAITYILDKDFITKFYKYSKKYLNKNFIDRFMTLSLNSLEELYKIKLQKDKLETLKND